MNDQSSVAPWPTTREDVSHHIANVWSIGQYLAFLNRDVGTGGGGLHTDLAGWAEDGVTTAPQLADYLDGCCARNVEKSRMSAYD